MHADFDENDKGGYKRPVLNGDLSYEEVEEIILTAISEKNKKRTPKQIKEFGNLEDSFDLSPVLEGMCLEKKIDEYSNGSFTAYFPYKPRVKRMWLPGDKTVEAEFESSGHMQKDTRSGKSEEQPPAKLTAFMLRKLASENRSNHETAKQFGFAGLHEFNTTLRTRPEWQEAFNEGRRLFAAGRQLSQKNQEGEEKNMLNNEIENTEAAPETTQTSDDKTKLLPLRIKRVDGGFREIPLDEFKDLAASGKSIKVIAEELGVNLYAFKNLTAKSTKLSPSRSVYRDAWCSNRISDKSRAKASTGRSEQMPETMPQADIAVKATQIDQSDQIGHTDHPILAAARAASDEEQKKATGSVEEHFKVAGVPPLQRFLAKFFTIPQTQTNVRRLSLSQGSIQVAFTGNYSDMTEAEQNALAQIDQILSDLNNAGNLEEKTNG